MVEQRQLLFTWVKEESPGCSETGFHLTDGRGNMRESATENVPPSSRRKSFLNLLHLELGKGEKVG